MQMFSFPSRMKNAISSRSDDFKEEKEVIKKKIVTSVGEVKKDVVSYGVKFM